MKNLVQKAAILGISLALCGSAFAADQKIAVVDLRKVFDKYYKTIQSTSALKNEASEMEKERKEMADEEKRTEDEWKALIDKANDQAVSSEARDKSKKAAEDKMFALKTADKSLAEFDKQATAKLHEKERQRRDDIVRAIRDVLDANAKAAGYTLVIDISGESANMAPIVLYSSGANDLTDGLIKELNAAAPPDLLTPKETSSQ